MPTRKVVHEPLRLTAAQCRAVDRYAIEQLGIPSLVLMENAGRNAADLIESWVRRGKSSALSSPLSASIVCGKGNNGGDGFVIARHLSLRGFKVSVDLLAESLPPPAATGSLTAGSGLSPDATVNCAIVQKMGLPVRLLSDAKALAAATRRWHRSHVVADALLGTGFTGEVREPMAGVIRQMNSLDGPLIVAVDVPSGLNADTGQPGGIAVRAHRTVTFLAEKVGFALPTAKPYVGRVSAVDIGAPLAMILAQVR
ncbi:MAG TPA: NAD(P)H-hydrate epimerase [Phycisphaerae bacterium]|jgi:NAD(P)H-hydrate epimerase|nr:NAD(P)H-hydrate epimerase [Phycisphaerae bacterium]HOB74334.1 NAD(P)H-hydrate epimerase [Phycisphaerae bacterium]HOJ53075.1 NAD(P)H-hydrate epimerase [Phycisphaerae bacterium]HOL24812.1 NAD(P)H-hydrate epimerase [Phycisphaerae bacterium]HPP19348.1 NAD(P)H-hydrate epimerase [Phycisphaerae bacterium]